MYKDSPTDPFLPVFWIEQWNLLNASRTAYGGYSSPATWNAMAADYGRQPRSDDKDQRVHETIAHLENKGVQLKGARILDVGCGPGNYAAVFAEKGAEVVCVDDSDQMIQRLKNEIDPALRPRITPIVTDWASLDLDARGFTKAFDLVFANMTPAVSNPDAFLKLIAASRNWCWFRGWAGPRENPLLEKLHAAIFSTKASVFTGNAVCAYNLVCSLGYFPDCRYAQIQWTHRKPLAECHEFHKTFFEKTAGMSTGELSQRIGVCLEEMAVDGYIENSVTGHTASMLWTLTDKIGD